MTGPAGNGDGPPPDGGMGVSARHPSILVPEAMAGRERDSPAASGAAGRGSEGGAGSRGRAGRRGPVRWKVAFFVLAAVGIVAAVAWALLGSRFFVVRSVQVTGAHLVSKSEVVAAAQIPMGLPLMRVNTADVARRVERIPQVASAQVTRQWPNRVLIAVRERTPVFAVPAVGGFDLVDGSGVVVRQVTKPPRGMPRFIPAGPLPGNPGLRAAVAVLHALPAQIAYGVMSVTAPSDQAVTLHLARGITVVWGNSGQAARKAKELAILLRTRAHYYDVSAPGSAVTG